MTSLLLAAAALAGLAAADFDQTHAPLDAILTQYVQDGLVDYGALKAGREPLDRYLETVGAVPLADFQRWKRPEQLAFLINLYNAATLQLIVDHYPVDSIKSIGTLLNGPWSRDSVLLFGKRISLDTLEHKIIRKNYTEPRIHFALVCAALGCPPLRAEAYQGSLLEAQLDGQVRDFLDTPDKNWLDVDAKRIHLSPIFKWYRKDFEAGGGSLQAFVAPYMAGDASLEGFDVTFTDYDWSLNVQPVEAR